MTAMIERPQFVGWITLLAQVPVQLFLTFWAGMFFGGFVGSFLGIKGDAPFVFFGATAFILVPLVSYVGKRLNYSRTEYRFYIDHLEFEEGFFSRNKKSVRYRDILEVTLRRGILQQSCNLGTIYLGTMATGSNRPPIRFFAMGFGNVAASGIAIQDLLEPEAAYTRIRDLVDSAKLG